GGSGGSGGSVGHGAAPGAATETEAQAMAAAACSSNPEQKALYRMLLRQHQSIDTLTEVVTTQAKTIATLVSLVGAGAGTGA
ncbi:unnamed protein product, partial [Ectocarpus sp. 12 AP-2014]